MINDAEKQGETNADGLHLTRRLLVAAISCPIVYFSGVWCSSFFSFDFPFVGWTKIDEVILLSLCPVFAAIAATAFVWRSRLMLIVGSLAVVMLSPSLQSRNRMKHDWRDIGLKLFDVQIYAFIVAAICCALIIYIKFRSTDHRAPITTGRLTGLAALVLALTLIAMGTAE